MSVSKTADVERRRAAETEEVIVTTHAERQWTRRLWHLEVDLEATAAWDEATPVHYRAARDGAVARYHPETEMLLLANSGKLVTCYPLAGRPADEQDYVRNQVRNE